LIGKDKKELISIQIIKTLYSRFLTFPSDSTNNRNAPFHEAFLNAFQNKLKRKVPNIPYFISLSSWLHGLNTTLGQSFFENVSFILSDGEKKEFTAKSNNLLNVTQTQKNNIADIITDLRNSNMNPDLLYENSRILLVDTKNKIIEANGFTVDVFIEEPKRIVCIELKSVKPNAGEVRGEKQKILEAKAALFNKYKKKKIEYYIGFPFDPTSDYPTESNKSRFLNSIIDGIKYLDEKEVLIAEQLWDFLSGHKNTMQELLDIINSISTIDFFEKYNFLNNKNNLSSNKLRYKKYLKEWNLYSELYLVENDKNIRELIKNNSRLIRVYNQTMFNTDNGEYNFRRFYKLSEELKL